MFDVSNMFMDIVSDEESLGIMFNLAEKAYQKKNPDFKLNVVQTADSTEVQNRITLAGQAQDYSTLPDIMCPSTPISSPAYKTKTSSTTIS